MREVFMGILNLSIVSSFLILAVLPLRFLLRKAPKVVRYVLWAMVALRLAVPYNLESNLSIIPNARVFDQNSESSTSYISSSVPDTTQSIATTQHTDVYEILGIVWLVGVVLMLIYMIVSIFIVHLMVRERVKYRDNIYRCDHIHSPFVIGVFSPKIYINSAMSDSDAKYIIAHEQMHITHRDHIFKPLGFILLCVYWFNPLCWLSYYLFSKDIELFCDESVIKTLDAQGKKEYSTVLLSCSSKKNIVTACPLAFSENDTKHRVKNVLNYKKPTVYIIIASVVLCAIVLVLFMTNPVSAQEILPDTAVLETQPPTQAVTEAPTEPPTEKPTQKPTKKPTETQSVQQSVTQTAQPVATQTVEPTEAPTVAQQAQLTEAYTQAPTVTQEVEPTDADTGRSLQTLSEKDAIKLDPNGRDVVHIAWDY